jgi:hypothetical protein
MAGWKVALHALVWIALAMGVPCRAADMLPNDFKHMGVASCATSVCHGKASPAKGPDVHVQLNEYAIWSRNDRHSQAFKRLNLAAAIKIGTKLGIDNPAASKRCTVCHADTQTANASGPTKFRQSDGVGCEACHGGSEKWIDAHSQINATHKDNVSRGMYPTEQPLERAKTCLSCHLGTKDRFATHVIMGAGHPRLMFELNSFSEDQPRHYDPTAASYIKRKGQIDGMNLWVTGQIESAERSLLLLDTDLLTPGGMIPELAFYECFSCHHRTDDLRWSRAHAGPNVNPGTLRLQRQNLVMLQSLASVVEPAAVVEIQEGINGLVRAGQADPQTLRASARKLLAIIRQHEGWSARRYSKAEVAQVRRVLLQLAADDKASDFTVAEQVFMGVVSLSYALGEDESRKKPIALLLDKVKSGPDFNGAQFIEAVRRVQGQF